MTYNVALSIALCFFYIVSVCYSLEAADKPLLRDLLNNVKTTKWYRLGLELDIDSHSLDIIECDASGVEERLKRVFQKWLTVCKKPSWRATVNAPGLLMKGHWQLNWRVIFVFNCCI